MLLLIVLALVALVFLGFGFTVHWLFAVAVIAALVFVISLLLGSAGGRARGYWW